MLINWLQEKGAGGVNTYDDAVSIPDHQVVQCDNYYPVGMRWKTIEGNAIHVSAAIAERIRHLVEYQIDDGALGTTKKMLRMLTNLAATDSTIEEIGTGTAVVVTGPVLAGSETTLWDTTVFQGVMLMASGVNPLQETSDAITRTSTTNVPTNPQFVEAWKNRVFIVRPAAPLVVAYSADGDRTTWTGTDSGTETITSPVGDVCTGIRSVENYLALFTKRTITVLIGDHPDDWTKRTLYEDHGCSSHRTFARINGGIIYANDHGVWLLSAEMKRLELTKDIRQYWQNFDDSATKRNKARGKFMHAVYDPTPGFNRYLIWVSEGTSTKEDVCWIYHFNSGAWTRMVSFMDTGQTSQASALREDTSGNIQTYFATGSDDITTSDKKTYKISNASSFASKTGGDIASTLKTKIFAGPFIPQDKLFGILQVQGWENLFALTTGTTSSASLTYTFDNYNSQAKGVSAKAFTQSITSTTADFIRARIPIGLNGWGLQVTITFTGQVPHSIFGGIFNFDIRGTM